MGARLHVVSRSTEAKVAAEQALRDHCAVISSYLDTHRTRNHAARTHEREERFLKHWFDSQGPGDRPLLVWEAMEPVRGRERVIAYVKRLGGELGRSASTVMANVGILRRFFAYVIAWPYIPQTSAVAIQARYGPVEQPVLAYDYPAHAWNGRREDAPMSRSELRKLYAFLLNRIRHSRRALTAARDYAMVVVAAESGLRVQELCALEIHRDLLFGQSRLQTRAGKGSRGSGPKVRQTIFTPFAQATVRHFMQHVRSQFPRWSHQQELFLSERGTRISKGTASSALKSLAKAACGAKLRIPPRFGWHSLRRSFATTYSEEHPGTDHTLMQMLGHANPSTLQHYIHHTRAYHERVMDGLLGGLVGG